MLIVYGAICSAFAGPLATRRLPDVDHIRTRRSLAGINALEESSTYSIAALEESFTDSSCMADECWLPDSVGAEPNTSPREFGNNQDASNALDIFLVIAPVILPLLAGLLFDEEVGALHNFLTFLAQSNWVDADGGLSRTAALLPLMTGIVLPCVSFALGTLTATTISTLRARQIQLRTELNSEACLVRSILSATESLFPRKHCASERAKAGLLIRQYCTRLLVESRSGINLQQLARDGAANSELDGLTRLLHHAPALPAEVDGVAVSKPRFEHTTEFLAQMYLEKLQLVRSERLAVLQTTFPAVHWLALTLLGVSIVFSFLLAADQQTLLFLAPLQLRLLFSVLVGALTSTACICVDLNEPFGGSFQITPSSEQVSKCASKYVRNRSFQITPSSEQVSR